MSTLRYLLAFSLVSSFCWHANADFSYEGFAYQARSQLVQSNGGTGFPGSWNAGGFNAVRTDFIISNDSLSYLNLETSGRSVSTTDNTTINGIQRAIPNSFNSEGTHFLSFLIRRDNIQGAFNGFGGLYLNGTANDLFIGKPGAIDATGDQWVLENRGGGGLVSSGVSALVGETTLLVVKMERTALGSDSFSLFVNPVLGNANPTANALKSDLNLGTINNVVLYTTGAYTYDEIRFGDTLQQVLPISAVPESSSVFLVLLVSAIGVYRRFKKGFIVGSLQGMRDSKIPQACPAGLFCF